MATNNNKSHRLSHEKDEQDTSRKRDTRKSEEFESSEPAIMDRPTKKKGESDQDEEDDHPDSYQVDERGNMIEEDEDEKDPPSEEEAHLERRHRGRPATYHDQRESDQPAAKARKDAENDEPESDYDSQQRSNRRTGDYQTGESGTVGRDKETGRIVGRRQTRLSSGIKERLQGFSDKFHEVHSGRNQAKINPLYDQRKDPMVRFEDYLNSEWNEFGDDTDAALEYAEGIFKEQDDDIAGNWKYRKREQQQESSSR